MPIGGKEAFLSKVTFRRESDWVSKTKQMLKDMESIEERAKASWHKRYPAGSPVYMEAHIDGYITGATEQKEIDNAKYKKLRKLAYDMYTAAQYLTTDASTLKKAIDAFHQFISYEESIMED